MEGRNLFHKKIERKKFFYSLGAGFAGYFVLRSFPFKLFSKREKSFNNSEKIKVKINPLAVSRNKLGGK